MACYYGAKGIFEIDFEINFEIVFQKEDALVKQMEG